MKQISSRMTWVSKYIFPSIWFGVLGIMLVVGLTARNSRVSPPLPFFIMPVVMAAFGYFLMRKLVWDLADEVLDAGDSLIVRFGVEEQRIPLASITNVSYAYMINPARVTLRLRESCRFGREIAFAAPTSYIPFARSQEIEDLIERVDAARRAQN
jgi:hypothetical protein